MPGLTDAERRGARLLAFLLVLGTATDLYRAHFPVPAPEVTAPAARADSASATPVLPQGSGAPAVRLDLNTASVQDLDRLPGIGPVLAQRIVVHRARHGRFRSVDELLAVPGIGPRLLERLRPFVRDSTGP